MFSIFSFKSVILSSRNLPAGIIPTSTSEDIWLFPLAREPKGLLLLPHPLKSYHDVFYHR